MTIYGLLQAIRVQQYAKNGLIFLPLLAGHLLMNSTIVCRAMIGFVCFCLIASSVYLINDILDLSSDKQHPIKSNRALASGQLSLGYAWLLIGIFSIVGFILSLSLPIQFSLVLLIYYVISIAYSLQLKQLVLVDVIVLSLLYTIRIIAGMTLLSSNNSYSPWMLLFSMFFFLSLAFLKRVSELYYLKAMGFKELVGRNYCTDDTQTFSMFGIISGFMAILVFALYLNSNAAMILYHHTTWLLLVFPFMLYWLCRMWLLATQGKINEDPVVYTLRDKVSYYIGACLLFILYLGSAS